MPTLAGKLQQVVTLSVAHLPLQRSETVTKSLLCMTVSVSFDLYCNLNNDYNTTVNSEMGRSIEILYILTT